VISSMCVICGKYFTASRVAQFCSKKCANTAWYKNNKEHRLTKNKLYRQNALTRANVYNLQKVWFLNNSEKMIKYRLDNKLKFKIHKKKRYQEDLNFRLRECIRSRLNHSLRNLPKIGSAINYLGCSIEELKAHLELKFLSGMAWTNYGSWHIDHIRPLSSFDLTDPKQFKVACHYTNLQPLWAKDNLRKGAKYG